MLTFLRNLWAVGGHLPSVLALIRALFDFFGSERVRKLLQSIVGAATELSEHESPTEADISPSLKEHRRRRLWDRIQHRIALKTLDMTEDQYVAFCQLQDVSGPTGDEHFA